MNRINNWEAEDVLSLLCVKNLTSPIVRDIVGRHSSFDEFLSLPMAPEIAARIMPEAMFDSPIESAKNYARRQMETAAENKCHVISYWSPEYPFMLKDIEYPPLILFVRGELSDPSSDSIAVVGTRLATNYGKLTTERYAEAFARAGAIVTSGMAYGIDRAAHYAAMKAGGKTYAVIASGLDRISPQESQKVADEIVESGGAVITEYSFGTVARPAYFPRRNRIVSGISRAALVVESRSKGGALITAQFAFDQNRDLFAVPGRITDEKSSGCNMLIKKNMAQPTTEPNDILEALGLLDDKSKQRAKSANCEIHFATKTEKTVYDAISFDPIHIDELSLRTEVEISELLVVLLKMEFNNTIRQLPGKHYIRVQ